MAKHLTGLEILLTNLRSKCPQPISRPSGTKGLLTPVAGRGTQTGRYSPCDTGRFLFSRLTILSQGTWLCLEMAGAVGVLSELRSFRDKLAELEPRALDVKALRKYSQAQMFIIDTPTKVDQFISTNPRSFEQFTRDLRLLNNAQ